MKNKWGIHAANGPIDFTDLKAMIAVGADNYVVLHYQAAYLERLRQAAPEGEILCRYYDVLYGQKDPLAYARAVAEEAVKWQGFTRRWTFDNEDNLEEEFGPGFDDPLRVVGWKVAVAGELKRLCPWIIVHSGAFSPTGRWQDYYKYLTQHADAWDVIDVHCYGTFAEMVAIYHSVAVSFPENTKLFITECNGPGTVEFTRRLQAEDSVEAVAYFIWEWHNAPVTWNRDLRGSELAKELAEAIKAFAPSSSGDNDGGVGMDKHEAILDNIWDRQGIEANPAITFYQYALRALREQGRIIAPLPSRDGNYYVQVGDYYICYTNPLLWAPVGNPAEVHEGLPPF